MSEDLSSGVGPRRGYGGAIVRLLAGAGHRVRAVAGRTLELEVEQVRGDVSTADGPHGSSHAGQPLRGQTVMGLGDQEHHRTGHGHHLQRRAACDRRASAMVNTMRTSRPPVDTARPSAGPTRHLRPLGVTQPRPEQAEVESKQKEKP